MTDVQEQMPGDTGHFSEAVSVIAGKRTVIRRIAITTSPAFNIASVSSKLAQINVLAGPFLQMREFLFQGNTDFIITVGNVEMPALVIAT